MGKAISNIVLTYNIMRNTVPEASSSPWAAPLSPLSVHSVTPSTTCLRYSIKNNAVLLRTTNKIYLLHDNFFFLLICHNNTSYLTDVIYKEKSIKVYISIIIIYISIPNKYTYYNYNYNL